MVAVKDSSLPDMDLVVKTILREQFSQIERQEALLLSGGGREALHDFRVAVRRIRTLLGECDSFLATDLAACRGELGWLGQATSPLRDTDVLLARFPDYLQALVPAVAKDLRPLLRHLHDLQQNQSAELIRLLHREQRYFQLKAGLQNCLTSEAALLTETGEELEPLSTRVIDKAFRRLLRQGERIEAKSPDEDLHQLRKSGKKLRYLLEFFADFYPTRNVHEMVVVLKCLQDNLGRFQDLSVQRDTLRNLVFQCSATEPVPVATALALETLLVELQGQKNSCRTEFGERFQWFRQQSLDRGWLQLARRG